MGHSVERQLREPGPANVAGLVSAAAAADPHGPALIAGDQALSWADLDAEVDAAAAGLRARDLRFGDRVALLLANGTDFVLLYLGALRAGLTATSERRCPVSRSACSTGTARTPLPATPVSSGCAGRTCSPATGRTGVRSVAGKIARGLLRDPVEEAGQKP